MDSAPLTALVTGASTLAGVALGGVVDGARARRGRRDHERDELDRRLTRFLTALDNLTLEMRGLPRQGPRTKLVNEWLASRAPAVEFFFGQMARGLLGRPLYSAMHAFHEAGNALLLAPPREVLAGLEHIGERLADFEDRDNEFFDRLQQAKEDLLVVGRLAVIGRLEMPRGKAWWRPARTQPPAELPTAISERVSLAARADAGRPDGGD
jgi:hypothetical protein